MRSINLNISVAVLAGLALSVSALAASAEGSLKRGEPLRVCADPGNMPMSNDRGEGYSNKIAKIIAEGMGTTVSYFYRPYLNRGLTRQTFDNNECDVLMDMTPDDERMLTTRPLFKSTFVLAYRNDRNIHIQRLDDPRLMNDLQVGVFQHSAIRTVLQEHGIKRDNTHVRMITHDADLNPELQPHMDVQSVVDGKLDVAAIWGPMAGWYKTIKQAPIELVPVNLMEDRTPLEFPLAIGLHKNAKALRAQIEEVMLAKKDEIRAVFDAYGVPLVKCDECVVSGSLPSHGAYHPVIKHEAAVPPQSDPATLPARINEALKQGATLESELFNAIIARDNPRIEYLLKRGAKINAKDQDGQTPLMTAVKTRDLSIINGLLEYQADPNLQDDDGWTAAMHGVRSNEPKIFRLLGKFKANFNKVNKDGLTALALAVIDNKANAAVAMLDYQANPDLAMGEARYNVLMLAVKKGNLSLAQTLLQYKANPNAKNAGGLTPLMIAAFDNNEDMVSLLLKAGANQGVKDAEGKTALMLARENQAGKTEALLSQGTATP